MDGEISATIVNNDFVGGIAGEERVILTFGMRRGGDSVFALDVTDRDDPRLLWEINSSTSGFDDLGQTWSTPQVAKVKVDSDYIDVAVFGGGYDAGQDNGTPRQDGVGNAIYMVNLLTGDKVWSAGKATDHDLVLSNMDHSIPAPLRVIDLNTDGLADRIYVGDMGGRVWRYDIFNGSPVAELGQGGLIASLGAADLGTPVAADVRRFYNQVDVVDYAQEGVRFLSLNVGSGYRAHPLDRALDEEFYSIRDYNPIRQLNNADYGAAVIRTDLTDITALPSARLDTDDAGWRLRMVKAPGEKVLSRSLTFKNTVYFSSFAPGSGANACNPAQGVNRLYKIDLLTGDPVYNLDESVEDEELTDEDRSFVLRQGSIAPQIEILFTADDPTQGTGCVGTECDQLNDGSLPTRTYWTQDGSE
jgi:type IV pilus assembly protein PilY1